MNFKMPEPRDKYVIRKNIFEKLEMSINYKVTVVKAGAGCGKTTVLSSFIRENNLDNINWISLSESTNNVFIFWNNILKVLSEYLVDNDSDLEMFIDSNIQGESLFQIIPILASKLEIDKDIFIILDDFHLISDEVLLQSINCFIENISNNVHLILSTREVPKVYLGMLAMENEVMTIEDENFILTEDEGKKFLNNTLNVDGSKEKIENIIKSADGWIGGLQLLALSYRNGNDSSLKNIKLSSCFLNEYINKEIFQFLDKEEQLFLVETCILKYFDKDICSKYNPDINFDKILSSILKKNLFIIKVDNSEEIYKYHDILREYLKTVFDKMENKKKLDLYERAADIYYEMEDYEEALNNAFIVYDYEKIMEWTLYMPQNSVTFSYMMKVPMKEIYKNIDFAYQYFFCHYASFDLENCQKIYKIISENVKNQEEFSGLESINMFLGENWELEKVNILSLDQINKLPLNPISIAFIVIKEAYFLFAGLKYDLAIKYLDYAECIYKKSKNTYVGLFIFMEKAQLCEEMGRFNECYALYDKIKIIVDKFDVLKSPYYVGIAGVDLKRLNLKDAFDNLEYAKKYLSSSIKYTNNAYNYTLLEYYYLSGDSLKAKELFSTIYKNEVSQNIYMLSRILRYQIYKYDDYSMMEMFLAEYDSRDEQTRTLDCDFMYAIIQYKKGNIEIAIDVVDKMTETARKVHNNFKIVDGDLFKIRMLIDTNEDVLRIQNLFIEAISYAYKDNILLSFWFEMDIVKKIFKLHELEFTKKLSEEELKFISAVLSLDKKDSVFNNSKILYDLTEREVEVLKELQKGKTNKKIAEELYISLATVKSHIINIYGKLGVNNRISAVNMFFKN